MNLKHAFLMSLFAVSSLGLASCSDDDKWPVSDGADPDFKISSEHVMTVAGRTVKFAGKITDADGIASINLSCPELLLQKTINIIDIYGEPLKEYDLDYDFKIQPDVQGESFNVVVSIIDVAGKKTERTVLVTLDGDFTAPVFTAAPDREMTVLIKANTVFKLNFTVEDNVALDYVTVDVKGVAGYPVRIEANGQKKIEYANSLSLPSSAAQYELKIEAYDKAAQDGEVRSTVIESVLNVSELPDFDVLYLADVETAAELNSDVFGVPMAMDHVAPYKYRVRYYNEKAGTKICFIPQKTDFGPICFGPDNENPNTLGDDPESVGRITLDKAGVYYLIEVNTYDRTVKLDTYAVADAINPVMHLRYGQDDLWTWSDNWNQDDPWMQEWYFGPASGPDNVMVRMEQDPANPNIFIVPDWKLEAGGQRFILHNWHSHGWWNYTTWRVDNGSDPSKCVYYGIIWPDNVKFKSNKDYFDWKYTQSMTPEEFNFMFPGAGGSFNETSWGTEDYRKNFIGDNWIDVQIPADGSYKIVFDAHAERIKMLRK